MLLNRSISYDIEFHEVLTHSVKGRSFSRIPTAVRDYAAAPRLEGL